ncbi:MAG: PH domain-containing protein, partial [Actinomycetota bacterium]
LRRVADLSLRRSVLQRLVGSGTVIIEIAGRDGEAQERVVLDDVPQARRVYAELARLTAGRAREEDG